MCTCISCPVGSCLGCCSGCFFVEPPHRRDTLPLYQRRLMFGFPLYQVVLFCFGICFLCLYLPLATLCSQSSPSGRWSLYPDAGNCWSEGNPQYTTFGLFAGFPLGFTFIWLFFIAVSFCRSYCNNMGSQASEHYSDEEPTCSPLPSIQGSVDYSDEEPNLV